MKKNVEDNFDSLVGKKVVSNTFLDVLDMSDDDKKVIEEIERSYNKANKLLFKILETHSKSWQL